MQVELINLQRNVGVTFVFVTHSQPEALALSHRIAVMNEGRIAQLGTPAQIYSQPANRFVADFIGDINMLPGEIVAAETAQLRLSVTGLGEILAPPLAGAVIGQRGVFAIRPEQVRVAAVDEVAAGANRFTGTVRDFLYVGEVTTYKVELSNGTTMQALLPNSAPGRPRLFEIGDAVAVTWQADAGMYLHE
jgi:spermidine/putrescine transport system ATP-binding protein